MVSQFEDRPFLHGRTWYLRLLQDTFWIILALCFLFLFLTWISIHSIELMLSYLHLDIQNGQLRIANVISGGACKAAWAKTSKISDLPKKTFDQYWDTPMVGSGWCEHYKMKKFHSLCQNFHQPILEVIYILLYC